MHSLFKSIPSIGLLLFGLWSCSLEDVAPHKQVTLVDPLPLAKENYEAEKPRQVNSSFRIQAEHEIFPFWAGAKSHADGRILIVPAHRKLLVRYEAGYLRRFVFELDVSGKVLRGGMLELAGKDSKFLLQNEALLIEGFLAGVKSKDLTYIWSDFVARPLDGTQADGRVVALQREGGAKSRLNAEALRTEFCIDWYWVYSSNGVVMFEVYSHTTCGSASCDTNSQDACLDDGIGAGGDGDSVPYKIENNVKNPCFRDQVNKAIDSQFKNKITNLIRDVFSESENFHIYLEDSDFGNHEDDGDAFAHEVGGNVTFSLSLNTRALENASQEFVLVTIFHELLHAYLGYLKLTSGLSSSQHNLMASEYVELLSSALMEHYSISKTDAVYLSWGGLHNSDKWKKDFNDKMKNQILEKNRQYKSGDLGTNCN
jgi:hypothetical protein